MLEEAHRMAAEALTLHIAGMVEDGETIRGPSSLDALSEDPARKHAVAFWFMSSQRQTGRCG